MVRIWSLSAALAIMTVLPALGDEVPFAAPPLPAPGQPSITVASYRAHLNYVPK